MYTPHILYATYLMFACAIGLAAPEYWLHLTLSFVVATGVWFYFSVRRPGGMRGDARYGTFLAIAFVGVPAVFIVNEPVNGFTPVVGTVSDCISSTQRLTGRTRIVCRATIDAAHVETFEAAQYLPRASKVAFRRYPRRLLGNHYEYAGGQ